MPTTITIKHTEPIKFRKKGDVIYCEGYFIEPFKGRLMVYTEKIPYKFFDSIKDAKKYVRLQLRAKYVNDYFLKNVLLSRKIMNDYYKVPESEILNKINNG